MVPSSGHVLAGQGGDTLRKTTADAHWLARQTFLNRHSLPLSVDLSFVPKSAVAVVEPPQPYLPIWGI